MRNEGDESSHNVLGVYHAVLFAGDSPNASVNSLLKIRGDDMENINLNNKKADERDMTLTFTIQGYTQSDYIANYKAFMEEMSSGLVSIQVPILGSDIYHVYYKNAVSYAMSLDRTFSKIAMKVCEPNPANRT